MLPSRGQSRPQVGENAGDISDEGHFGCRMLEALLGTVVASGCRIVSEADALCIVCITLLVGVRVRLVSSILTPLH